MFEQFPQNEQITQGQIERFEDYSDYINGKFNFDNSDDAYEMALQIQALKKSLEAEGLNPKEFYLWNALVADTSKGPDDFQKFDTPDGKIEAFIQNLENPEALEEAA